MAKMNSVAVILIAVLSCVIDGVGQARSASATIVLTAIILPSTNYSLDKPTKGASLELQFSSPSRTSGSGWNIEWPERTRNIAETTKTLTDCKALGAERPCELHTTTILPRE